MEDFKNTSWHSLTCEQVFEKLKTGKQGLSAEEVALRQKQFGKNELPETGRRHWFTMLLNQLKSALVFILLMAAFISVATGHTVDAYVIVAVILINTSIGFIQELRAERKALSLKSLLVPAAKVIRSGQKATLPASELVPGDLIVLEEGDSIPADARLIEARNVRVIEAPLTGESVPVNKNTEPLPENTFLADQKNMVRKSTFMAGGYALGVVTGTGLNTAIGNIARTLQSIKPAKTNFQKKTDVLARQMAIIAVASALTLFSVAYFVQQTEVEEILLIAMAALVSSIPEGLPAVLAIVLAIGAYRMSQRNAIIREFPATETLGAVTAIITDKTGTLTMNTLTVRKVLTGTETEFDITGEGWFPAGNFFKDGKITEPEHHEPLKQLLKIAAWCNNSAIQHDKEKDVYNLIGDPTEGALLVLAHKGGCFPDSESGIRRIDDLPFNSSLKMRATLIEANNKNQLLVVGAPEQVLEKSSHLLTAKGIVPITDSEKEKIRNKIEQWSGNAMRVIALASRQTDRNRIEETEIKQLTFAGLAGMIDPPRPDAKQAVALCRQAGIRVIMATGDHINTAMAIARETGIIDTESESKNTALTENQLLALDEKEFEKAVAEVNVFARLTPDMKLRIATVLQQQGELIAMTGDGVNDAPALRKADVGVAMGLKGTDVARDAAKVVLADDNFSTIVYAVEEGRIVFTNARQTSFFLVTTNFAEVTTLVTAIASGLPVPLTATQILWLNLVTDGVCDISLATESGHGDVLKQKPVSPKEKILNREIIPFLIIMTVLMTTLALTAFTWFLPQGIEKARSAAFITMAFCQLFNALNMRSLKLSVFKIGLFTNKYLNAALIVSVIVQAMIIEVPFFEKLFRFDPVSFSEFVTLALMASLILWSSELYKFLRYRKKINKCNN